MGRAGPLQCQLTIAVPGPDWQQVAEPTDLSLSLSRWLRLQRLTLSTPLP